VPWKLAEREEQSAASPHMVQERACVLRVKGISYNFRRLEKNKVGACWLVPLCL
jgi:hypothetical protein